MEFLEWLSATPLPAWVRESESIWAYPTVLFVHSLGMAMLVGFIAAVDIRLLGLARAVPIASMRRLIPLVWAGFWLAAASGTMLLAIDPSKLRNPVFTIKLLLIALGAATMWAIKKEVFAAPGDNLSISGRARLLGAASLALWLGTITAGRLLAYVGVAR